MNNHACNLYVLENSSSKRQLSQEVLGMSQVTTKAAQAVVARSGCDVIQYSD
jgi:hypothetical protein